MNEQPATSMIEKIDRYLDLAPRQDATVEQVGPFTLFLSQPGGWSYFARPALPAAPEIDGAQVAEVVARQQALGQPVTVEGLCDTAPSLATACRDAGLVVQEYPLMVHHDPVAVPVPDGIRIRRLQSDDAAVAASQVVAALAFAAARDETGLFGPSQRDELLRTRDPLADDYLRQRIETARTVVVVAEDETGVLSCGAHHPVDEATELVGLATLPSARRRGLGAAVADTLVADAFRRGVTLAFISVPDASIARTYERIGFREGGMTLTATVR